MSNFTLDRIQKQTAQSFSMIAPKQEIISSITLPVQKTVPISEEQLKADLEKLFCVEELPVLKMEEPKKPHEYIFPDLFHFVEWYLVNQHQFTENQQRPLKTLVEARDLINVGCACKRQQRFNAATNYFQIFWNNNLTNDLLPTVLRVAGTKSIVFGNFLMFP
jgi:hypothetical protein